MVNKSSVVLGSGADIKSWSIETKVPLNDKYLYSCAFYSDTFQNTDEVSKKNYIMYDLNSRLFYLTHLYIKAEQISLTP